MTARTRTPRLSHPSRWLGLTLAILTALGSSLAARAADAPGTHPTAPEPQAAAPLAAETEVAAPATAPDPGVQKASSEEELLARAKKLDPTLDFRLLRRLKVSKPDFRVSAYISPQYKIALDNLEAAAGREDAASIRKRCDAAFKIYFIEAKAHALCGLALEKAGDKEGAEYERYLSQGLVASVMSTGDGKTWQTAYEVYAVSEEADVLFAAGLEKTNQGTLDGTTKEGKTKSFDVWTAKDPQTGKLQRIFFNVTALYTKYGELEDKKTLEDRKPMNQSP